MIQMTETVKHLLIINGLFFVFAHFIMPQVAVHLALYYPMGPFFKPFQLVTHMFMHANLTHIFFNMFALYMFGSALEAFFGPQRFLFYYFFCGFGALLLYFFVQYLEVSSYSPLEYEAFLNTPYRVVGASGAVFGLLAGFGTLFPNTRLMLIFPPVALKAKYFVLIYAAIELFLGLSRFQTGVAHFAHLGGALFGFLLIQYWRKTGRNV
jgi:membrane associated rhomboid family serine protease